MTFGLDKCYAVVFNSRTKKPEALPTFLFGGTMSCSNHLTNIILKKLLIYTLVSKLLIMSREHKFVALKHSRNQLFLTTDVSLTLVISRLSRQNSCVPGAEYVISALTRLYSPPASQLVCIKLCNVLLCYMQLNSLTGMLIK